MSVPRYTEQFNPAAIIGYSRRNIFASNGQTSINLTADMVSSDKLSGTIQSKNHAAIEDIKQKNSSIIPKRIGRGVLPPGIVELNSWTYAQVFGAIGVLVNNGEVFSDPLLTEQARVAASSAGAPQEYVDAYQEFLLEAKGFLEQVINLSKESNISFKPAKSVLIPRTALMVAARGGFKVLVYPEPYSARYVCIKPMGLGSHNFDSRGRDWRLLRNLAHEYYSGLGRRVEFIDMKFYE